MKNVYDGKFLKVFKKPFANSEYELVVTNDAVALLLLDTDGNILLVKQKRPTTDSYVWEIPAGMMDVDGEYASECIARELEEEANLVINPETLTKLTEYYPIIGCVKSKLFVYSGITEAKYSSKVIKNDDVEEAKWFSKKEVLDMISNGEIVDGKTILSFSLYHLNK